MSEPTTFPHPLQTPAPTAPADRRTRDEPRAADGAGRSGDGEEPQVAALAPNPFLHLGSDRVYNPLTDRTIEEDDQGYRLLRRLLAGEAAPEELLPATRAAGELEAAGWLTRRPESLADSFHLKYVSLEAHTVCNQACFFCPVAYAPREDYFMPTEQYEGILDQLTGYRETIEAIFMINYNEPTVDPRFVDQVASIRRHGLPPAVLTNATGLTPKRVDALVELGGLRYLSINLSTLDRQRYSETRQGDHLKVVMPHLDYMKDKPVGEEMEIVVLGTGDETHQRDIVEIRERFAGSRFKVKDYEVMDRAGYLQIGQKPVAPNQRLCGCQNVGSRPFQHLHITPQAKVVLCCEDYDEKYVVGDLNESTVEEVLTGPEMARMRRWVYGIEEAPESFICRRCIYALTR